MPNPINRLLSHLNLRVTRIRPLRARSDDEVLAQQVGNFRISMNSGMQLSHIYRSIPGYNGEIGRVAACVAKKYPAARAVDIGANVGDTVAIIRSSTDMPVLAIEGDAACFDFLVQNTARFPDVIAKRAFLDAEPRMARLAIEKEGWNATLVRPARGVVSYDIQFTTLDDIVDGDANRLSYKLVKVDTEGFDCRILRGARRLIADAHPVLIFEYNPSAVPPVDGSCLSIFQFLREMGYWDLLIWDAYGRFVTATNLASEGLLTDFDSYVAQGRAKVEYFDFCAVSRDDIDVAQACARCEREHRSSE